MTILKKKLLNAFIQIYLSKYQFFADLPRDGPHIKGQHIQYQIGETLNLNCTSGKSHPASHLQWFINDQAVSKI